MSSEHSTQPWVEKTPLNMITPAEVVAQIRKNQQDAIKEMGLGENPTVDKLLAYINQKIRYKIAKGTVIPDIITIRLPPGLSKDIRMAISDEMAVDCNWDTSWSIGNDGCSCLNLFVKPRRAFGKH